MSPEQLRSLANPSEDSNESIYPSKTDSFSLGLITLYSLDPNNYSSYKHLNAKEENLKKYLEDVWQQNLIPDGEFYEILKKMLSFDIESRLSILEVYLWMVIPLFTIHIMRLIIDDRYIQKIMSTIFHAICSIDPDKQVDRYILYRYVTYQA
jgi:hypothetical protein